MQKLRKSRAHTREEKGDNQESGHRRLYKSRAGRGRRKATIKRAYAEAVQIKGPRKEEKGDNKESGCRRLPNQGPEEGGRSGRLKPDNHSQKFGNKMV